MNKPTTYILSVDPSIQSGNLAIAGFVDKKLDKVWTWSDTRYPEKKNKRYDSAGKTDRYGLLRQIAIVRWLEEVVIPSIRSRFSATTKLILLIENNVGGVSWDPKRVNNLKMLQRASIAIVTVAISNGLEVIEVLPDRFPLPGPSRKMIVEFDYPGKYTEHEIDAIYRGGVMVNLPRKLWNQYQ